MVYAAGDLLPGADAALRGGDDVHDDGHPLCRFDETAEMAGAPHRPGADGDEPPAARLPQCLRRTVYVADHAPAFLPAVPVAHPLRCHQNGFHDTVGLHLHRPHHRPQQLCDDAAAGRPLGVAGQQPDLLSGHPGAGAVRVSPRLQLHRQVRQQPAVPAVLRGALRVLHLRVRGTERGLFLPGDAPDPWKPAGALFPLP